LHDVTVAYRQVGGVDRPHVCPLIHWIGHP
jgi:hypothetical protein